MAGNLLAFAALLIGLMLVGIPVGFAIGLAALILLVIESGLDANYAILVQRMFAGVDSFPLLAVPLFIITGQLMNTGGITRRIFGFAADLVGHLRLGLAQVNVVASMIFAGMSGAAVADAAGLGPVEMKAMLDAKYDRGYSAAVTAASSTIGPIVPPSIPLVIYGIMAEASIGKLLIGGIVPGVLIAACLMVMNSLHARRRGYPRGRFVGGRRLWQSFRHAFFPLLTPVILIGGILSGIFTPTEAAAVAFFYALILAGVAYREIALRDLLGLVHGAARSTAEVLFIVAGASALAYMIISAQIPSRMVELITSLSTTPWVVLLIINGVLLVLGCFLEPVAAITIVVPVLMPVVRTLGIDPVHFGLIVVYNLVIGLLTPPVGLVLFVTSKIAGIPVGQLARELLPFFVPLLAALLLITYIPALVLCLPTWLLGR